MDRISFIQSVSGIQQPEVLATFFDHFIVLKQIVQDYGKITVLSSNQVSISFMVEFDTPQAMQMALANIPNPPFFTIYGRQIKVYVETPADNLMQVKLR